MTISGLVVTLHTAEEEPIAMVDSTDFPNAPEVARSEIESPSLAVVNAEEVGAPFLMIIIPAVTETGTSTLPAPAPLMTTWLLVTSCCAVQPWRFQKTTDRTPAPAFGAVGQTRPYLQPTPRISAQQIRLHRQRFS